MKVSGDVTHLRFLHNLALIDAFPWTVTIFMGRAKHMAKWDTLVIRNGKSAHWSLMFGSQFAQVILYWWPMDVMCTQRAVIFNENHFMYSGRQKAKKKRETLEIDYPKNGFSVCIIWLPPEKKRHCTLLISNFGAFFHYFFLHHCERHL